MKLRPRSRPPHPTLERYHGLAHGALAVTAYHADSFRAPWSAQLGAHVAFDGSGSGGSNPLMHGKKASPGFRGVQHCE